MRYTPVTPLVAATAVREADQNDHILEASTAPPIKLTDNSYEHNPSVQSRKRLPLKMIISEMASRDKTTVETEPAHHSIHSHIDDANLHTAPIQNRCPGRYFTKKSLADPADDPGSQSENTCFSEVCFEGFGNEVASSDCQKIFPETSKFSKRDERCSRCADVKKVCPHKYYSTPCARSRFKCLYGNKVLSKTVESSGVTGPQTHQTERGRWLNNDDEFSNGEKYQDRKKSDYQSPSSAVSKHSNVDTGYAYYTEDENDNASLKHHPLDHSPNNIGSPTFLKYVHESTNATMLYSPLSSTYSSVNNYSDLSTDEYEHANYKRKFDSEYTSENRFLNSLVQYKSKHHKAENARADLLYHAKSRNDPNWKSDCKHTVDDLEHIASNTDQRYSTENLSSIFGNCDSGTLHNAVALSADPVCWYQVKYTRRTQSIRISTKLYGLPESEPRNEIPTNLQQTDCNSPSDWDSLLPDHGLDIMPYLSSTEDGRHEQPTSKDLVLTYK